MDTTPPPEPQEESSSLKKVLGLLNNESISDEEIDAEIAAMTDEEKDILYKLIARNREEGKRSKAKQTPKGHAKKRKNKRKQQKASRKKNRK
jgi:hypothetical protein